MKSKGTLVFMELLVMILVFALAAAVCLQVFAKAAEISARTAQLDEASILAQNAAEILKATQGDMEKAQSLSNGTFHLEIERSIPEISGMGQAEIQVYFKEDLLVSFHTGWQEVLP